MTARKKTDPYAAEEYRVFAAVRDNDIERVKALLNEDPTLVNAVAPKKPTDTTAMSPLQVALCTGWHRKIARYLLEHGADVNYCGDKNVCRDSYLVLFDAVNTAVWNARRYEWDGKDINRLVLKHTKEDADEAYDFLSEMLRGGADANRTDHYGRNSLMQAVSEAACICPVKNAETGGYYPGRVITPELTEDLCRVFRLLIAHGADKNNTSTYSKKSIREHYENESVWKICGIFWEE